MLKIDAEGLAPVILGDSDNLNVGDSVVAIGNPLGELTFTLTAGALFNMYGEVIGVTNAKYSTSSSSSASIDNIGFAIPINSIRKIVEDIIEKGYISKPYIGISVLDVSQETQQGYPGNFPWGKP